MNADGSGQKLLADRNAFDVEPRISPDGSSILFERLDFSDDEVSSVLVIRDLATGAARLIDAAGTAVNRANWSPDGQ